jgi:hypothetical protein
MQYSREQITEKLLTEWDYQESQVSGVVDKLMAMEPSLIKSFEHWFATGELPEEPLFSGFNPQNTWNTFGLKPPAIFLLLDWIRREPEEAIPALEDEYGIKIETP